MRGRAHPESLEQILGEVSRSFSLSIHVLPRAVRPPIMVGYLIARAADTIADTDAVPAADRRALLGGLRALIEAPDGPADRARADALQERIRLQVLGAGAEGTDAAAAVMAAGQSTPAERRLLHRLGECLAWMARLPEADQALLRRVLLQLIAGMDRDLHRFPAGLRAGAPVPPEQVVALRTLAELDQYTYDAAGCVGEFWTAVIASHLPEVAHLRDEALLRRGVCLGKALQMVNVVRDAPADLRAGRCYWPEEVLRPHGLTPAALARMAQAEEPARGPLREAARAATQALCDLARELSAEAWPYVQAIPPRSLRLRLSCTWPLLIGLETLAQLAEVGSPLLAPRRPVKIRRGQVYGLVVRSAAAAALDGLTGPAGRRLDGLAQRRLGLHSIRGGPAPAQPPSGEAGRASAPTAAGGSGS